MDHLSFLERQAPERRKISILPIPMGIGSDAPATAHAPEYLLRSGLVHALASAGFEIETVPAVPVAAPKNKDTKEIRLIHISNVAKEVQQAVKKEIVKGRMVLALGGDHAISVGTIAGASEAIGGSLGVIWIDAHADANTYENSTSKNVHGMGASLVLGFGDKRLANLAAPVKSEHFLYLGLKDLDQAEIEFIREQRIAAVTVRDILERGFSAVTERVAALQKEVSRVWVSLDMDSIDEAFAPGSAMATPGGLTYREISAALNTIGKQFDVVGMDVVEIVPEKDREGKTARLATELVASGFGLPWNWYTNYMSRYGEAL